jgi:TolB protein
MTSFGQSEVTVIIHPDYDETKPIPISLSGFTGEADSVIRFDLGIQGFEVVPPQQAWFHVKGQNSSLLEVRVLDNTQRQLIGKRFSQGKLRTLAHSASDAIIEAVMMGKRKGISRTKIAFVQGDGRQTRLYIADYDGHNAKSISNPGALVKLPAWAPGTSRIYYTSYRLGNPDIFSVDLAAGQRKVIARHSGTNAGIAVSPSGLLAMILSKGGSPDLYISDSEGGMLKQLTKTRALEGSPCWSPDGRKICVFSRKSGALRLWTIPASGGPMNMISTAGAASVTEPDWSPDGKKIAFTSQRRSGFDIWVKDLDTGETTLLTEGEDPYWAPNSRNLIFTRRQQNGRRILSLLDVPTKQVKDIAKVSESRSQATWAR